ncbi:hypothetical protein Ae707Ps1_6250 [Pseudonocardia sp. Ae707_Ps1]|nr:hypothetical protein Ae707Ps1_6250 [Pseudonocardia sp. Ae707_Ps1]
MGSFGQALAFDGLVMTPVTSRGRRASSPRRAGRPRPSVGQGQHRAASRRARRRPDRDRPDDHGPALLIASGVRGRLLPGGRDMGFWTRRLDRAADEREADALWWAWRRSCEGAELCTQVDTATGPTVVVPEVVEMVLGPPTTLLIKLLPGQLIGDVRRAACAWPALGRGRAAGPAGGPDPRPDRAARRRPADRDRRPAAARCTGPGRAGPRRGRPRTHAGLGRSGPHDRSGRDSLRQSVFTYGLLAQMAG